MKVTVYAVHVEAEGTDTRWNPEAPAHVTYSQVDSATSPLPEGLRSTCPAHTQIT